MASCLWKNKCVKKYITKRDYGTCKRNVQLLFGVKQISKPSRSWMISLVEDIAYYPTTIDIFYLSPNPVLIWKR